MAKSRYPFQLPLRAEQFLEIGHVTAQWAFLETEIDFALLDIMAVFEKAGRTVTEEERRLKKRFKDRVNQLREMAAEFYGPENLRLIAKINRLLDRAMNLQPRRNHIVHGRWRSNIDEEGNFNPSAVAHLHNFDAKEVVTAETYKLEKIEKLASDLSQLNRDFYVLAARSIRHRPMPPSSGTYFLRDR